MSHELDALVDPQDREYVARVVRDAERELVVASLLRHRVPEQLSVGDPMPNVSVTYLDQSTVIRLDELVAGRPAVLVFGSYT